MAYTINYSDSNKGTISIEDSTINQATSLDLPGRNTTSYGSVIANSFLNILENFGFIQEGVLREHVYIKGKKHNCIIHSVLKNEYL